MVLGRKIKAFLVAASLCGAAQAHAAPLFDNGTARYADFALLPFWQKVLTDTPTADISAAETAPVHAVAVASTADTTTAAQQTAVNIGLPAGCIEERHCAPAEWLTFLAAQTDQPRRAQLDAVNRWANAKPYVEDWVNWQVGDYWETPGEFIARGGDCEDFAIAKYFSLVRLGFPVHDLRIVVVSDTRTHGFHAVLAVRLDGTVWLLDNLLPAAVPMESQPQYVPVYSLNAEGWWMHSNPTIQLAGITITAAPMADTRARLARN
jgi:predicted transglutaminase-like cysteine proteinase